MGDLTDKEFLKLIGQRISMIRKEKGISQVELSNRCDFEKSNMRRIESGNTNPTILTLKKICKGLGIQLVDLLNFED